MRTSVHRLPIAIVAVLTTACGQGLPSYSGGRASPNGGAADASFADAQIVAEPAAPLDAVPRVVRVHVTSSEAAALELTRFRLFEGELNDAQLGYADDALLPETLEERMVPVLAWRTADGLVVAPTQALRGGARYALTYGKLRVAVLQVAGDETPPLMSFVWPPEGRSPSGLLGVWCGDAAIAGLQMPALLTPSGGTGLFRSGIAPGESSSRCAHFEAANTLVEESPNSLPPLGLHDADGTELVALEPQVLVRGLVEDRAATPIACTSAETVFGSGCARVEDDRLLLRTPAADALWSVQGPLGMAVEHVFSPSGRSLYLWPLPTDASFPLTVTTLDALGGVVSSSHWVRTKPPMPHMVIDEVLANPVGAEPRQEWVELVNDGLVAASLGGMSIVAVDGGTPLPDVLVPPGARVLVVNEGYDATGKWDPAPATDTLVVRVPKLGKDGLSNEGEPLELVLASGEVSSRFPAIKAKAGRSVYRLSVKSLDEFAMSALGASTPGAANASVP